MSDFGGDVEFITEPFRTTACAYCDYDFTGLPSEGICPECGKPYDQRFLILRGSGAGKFANAATADGRASIGLILRFLLPLVFFAIAFRWRIGSEWMLVMGAAFLIPAAGEVGRRMLSQRQHATMIFCCNAGFVQFDTSDSPLLRRLRLVYVVIFVFFMYFTFEHGRNSSFLILAAVTFVAMAYSLFSTDKRKIIAAGPDGQPMKLFPWREATDVTLKGSGENRHRLRLFRKGGWRSAEEVFTDAYIEWPDESSELLRVTMTRWIALGKSMPQPAL